MQLIKSTPRLPKAQPVIYEVTLTIDVEVIDEFDEWLQKHVEEMLAIPGFVSASISVVDNQDENNRQRCVQYRLSDQAALDSYIDKDAERMRAQGLEKFGEKISAQRRVLTIAQAATAQDMCCANCGTQLEGRFCSSCGQREEPRVPTMMSVVREFTNAAFGLESRLWRTILLLIFKPGRLTADYLAGKRQSYTSPLRIYLLFSIVTFAYFAFVGNSVIQDLNTSTSGMTFNLDEKDINISSGLLSPEMDEKIKQRTIEISKEIEEHGFAAITQHIFQILPTALLVFLPVIALVFKILYLGSGKYYVEHLVYLLHNHALVFVIILITAAVSKVSSSFEIMGLPATIFINLLWFVYLPYYFYRSMRLVYARSRWITIASFILIQFVYLVMFSLMLLITTIYAGYTFS
ncbi:MAG: DUF4286 family protein [Gammaproteobacteria bacterium]|nr:DUF4286 family protein [Gammaproteobacteria bacterium]NNC97464.1 DUF4286 family protein [Gammaproteobacteria bacterium]NNM12991.1 DUF4286 family protein [Gammaproteobacteria bacterium]